MDAQAFLATYDREIDERYGATGARHGVGRGEFALAIHSAVEKYIGRGGSESKSDVRAFVSGIRADDLCLALGCARGDESAWERLMSEHGPALRQFARQIASRFRWSDSIADDLVEAAVGDLYGVRGGERKTSKFASYAGIGSLRGWLRAVLHQTAVDHHRRERRNVPIEEAPELSHSPAPPSPIADRYRTAARGALESALSGLEPRQKLVLAYYYFENRTLKQIGELFGVHEATASRWLARAQADARKAAERTLRRDHGFDRAQIDECLTLAAESDDTNVRDLVVDRPAE